MRPLHSQAFSLVELAVAFGVMAFALLSILVLVPMGINSNKISVEQTRAAEILAAMEADLRNTHPDLCSGTSLQFGMPLPYQSNNSKLSFNTALVKNNVTGNYSVRIADTEAPAASGEPARYQGTVIYTRIASDLPAQSLAPMEALLIVNWPPVTGTSAADLMNSSKVSGYVKSYVAFPLP